MNDPSAFDLLFGKPTKKEDIEPEQETTEEPHPYLLAQSVDELKVYLKTTMPTTNVISVDVETNGLDTRKAKLAGFSFSVKEGTGIYVPTGHRIGTNVDAGEVAGILSEYLTDTGSIPIFWNAKYDVSVIHFNTGWKPNTYEDSMVAVFLDNPDRAEMGLKEVVKVELGIDLPVFESLFTPEERKTKQMDLSKKHPRRVVRYAASDADFNLRIYLRYAPKIREEFKLPYIVDNKLVEAIRRIEQSGGLVINEAYIQEQITYLDALSKELRAMVWRVAGYEFEIESPKQLGDAIFASGKVPSQGQTKKGWHRTSEKDLELIKDQHPVVEWVLAYRKVCKARDSYFNKLLVLKDQNIPIRFSFNQFSAPTYRLAAPGGSPDRDGKTGINIQAVSNGEARTMPAVRLLERVTAGQDFQADLPQEELLFKDDSPKSKSVVWDASQMGTLEQDILKVNHVLKQEDSDVPVCVRSYCEGCPVLCRERGIDVTRRLIKNVRIIPSVRQAFQAPPGYVLMGADYDRQEIVIGANLSKEPAWISALLQGVDLHAQTAMKAFNLVFEQWEKLPKDEKKRKRDIGKMLNFATFYGATAHTLSRNSGIPLQTCEVIYDGYEAGHPQLFAWMTKVKMFARKSGYTTTYFGRRRWLKEFYNSGDRKMEGFADRSAVNTCIQGTGADVIRIAMVKTTKWLDDNQVDEDMVRMVLSIHDELTFMIRENLVEQVVPALVRAMMFHVKGWEVQLAVQPKIGTVWGQLKEAPHLKPLPLAA